MTRTLYAAASWLLAALGVLHMAATFAIHHQLTSNALWFFSGGALMALCAAVNLVNRAYGRDAPGLRWVCRAANLLVTALFTTGGVVGHASTAALAGMLVLLPLLTVLSFLAPTKGRPV